MESLAMVPHMAECHLAWIIWWKSLSVTSEYSSRWCQWGKGRRALTDVFCSGSRVSHVQLSHPEEIFMDSYPLEDTNSLQVSCQGCWWLVKFAYITECFLLVTHICKFSTEIYLWGQKELMWSGRVHFDSAGDTFSLNNDHHHFHSAWFQTDGKGWLGRSRIKGPWVWFHFNCNTIHNLGLLSSMTITRQTWAELFVLLWLGWCMHHMQSADVENFCHVSQWQMTEDTPKHVTWYSGKRMASLSKEKAKPGGSQLR